MKITDTSDVWWKTAVVYCLDVETFLDSNGDGIGDLAGLVQRIDYLADLGVTCLWLMPIYPTPDRDDGYDITDLYGVDPRLGNHGDFVELVRTARDRGMRVILDLVVNHTSDRHPVVPRRPVEPDVAVSGLVRVVRRPAPTKPSDIVFPDQEQSIWTFDEKAGSHYLHRFYRHQPDLNVANPAVRDEIQKVIGFWLELGVSGFRVDAVPFFIEQLGVPVDQDVADPHEYLRELRSFMSRRTGDAVLLGEVNLPHKGQRTFFGDDGDELQMLFDFIGMQKLYLAMARGDARPLAKALDGATPAPPGVPVGHLRPQPRRADARQAHREGAGRGVRGVRARPRHADLRPRAPPTSAFDARRGPPPHPHGLQPAVLAARHPCAVLRRGDRDGRGALGRGPQRRPHARCSGRDARNGGFSDARPSRLPGPVVQGGFGPEHVNVEAQRRDESSLLAFVSRLIRRYREAPELGWGELEILDQPERAVLAHVVRLDDDATLAVHNLSAESRDRGPRIKWVDPGTRLRRPAL